MPKSGKGSDATWGGVAFDGIATASFTRTTEGITYVNSDTSGKTRRVSGNSDATASVVVQEPPTVSVGDIDTLVIQDSAATALFTERMIVTSIEAETDIQGAAIIAWTIQFEGDDNT